MSQVKKNIGEMFRHKREEMHLTLKEVENATSIRMIYLEAIEEGKAEKFLSPVYAIGFLKQYAAFLGFDGEKIIKENEHAFQARLANQDFLYGIGTLEKRGGHGASLKSWPNLMWIGASVLLLLSAWYLIKVSGFF